jgi:predicted metalloprotease with PDZ domain
MNRSRALVTVALVLALVGCSSSAPAVRVAGAARSVSYVVSIPDLTKETFVVEAALHGFTDDTLTFHFPVWAPGAYDLVSFGRYVENLSARTADGRALTVIQSDTNTFRIVAPAPETRLSYRVKDIEYLRNASWFGVSDIEPEYAFANATALFGYPAGYKEIPYTVTYDPPTNWDVAVALDRAGEGGAHTYAAATYDELVDAPVQMGTFQRFGFDYKGVPHIITVTAPEKLHDTTGAALVATTRTIVEAMSTLFGEIPYERYLFQHYLVDPRGPAGRGGFGALEHANSSTYKMPWWGQQSVSQSLASVIAHEYWHLWSPKRIHVHELGPFDYQKGPETASLWFAEGLTEYYARVVLSRLGISSPASFLGDVQGDMTGLYRRPQRMEMTELSRKIVHVPTTELVDLYKKGPLLGFLLDTEIRWQTNNRRSLDDAMRHFNEQYGKTGKTFGDEEIIPIIEQATGARLGEFYRRYIAGRDTLPFDLAFERLGLRYTIKDTLQPALGARLEPTPAGVRVAEIYPGGSAEAMGMRAGDIVTTFDAEGYSIPVSAVPLQYVDRMFVDVANPEQVATGAPTEYTVRSVSVTRDGRPMKIATAVRLSPSTVERLELAEIQNEKAVTIRRSMLGF